MIETNLMGWRFLISLSDHNNHDNTKVIKCRYCEKRIAFDDRKVSKNGIKIPLDYDTRIPHPCPGRSQAKLEPKIQSLDQGTNVLSTPSSREPILDEILKVEKQGLEEHNQIGIDIYHLTNEIEEIKQILTELIKKLSSPSFDGNRYR